MKIKVLLVDDEKEFIETLAERLEVRDFSVKTAFSGEDALTKTKEQDFDVVVLDVLMPGKNGIETLREIKSIKPLVKVIMLTGHATVETAIEGMKAGAYDYLMKPTDTNDLVGKITKAYNIKADQEERIRKAEIDKAEKEIINQQVIESGKLASLGDLAVGIAHEINNPVAIMVEEAGWIHDLLEDEPVSKIENKEEFERSLAQIKSQGIRCREITKKLLIFARKIDSSVANVNINEIIEDIIRFCSQRAKDINVVIHSKLGENLPILKVSLTEIKQVFLNIINNALDELEKRGGNISVTSMLENDYIVIDIQDDGPGMPAANINRIFDPFFTTKPVGKGIGLGLSICHGIIKKLGGNIDVNSTIDAGTTFRVRIPIKINESK